MKIEKRNEKLLFSERLANLGTLTASVAHEINNPLAYIIANLPEPDAELAQQLWLTLNQMHPSPIQGWPFGQKI